MNQDINQKSSLNLNDQESLVISEFTKRRNVFNDYIKTAGISLATCPSCGYPTILERAGFEICEICNWEDDGQDDENADEVLGGPNKNLSLTASRLIVGKKLLDLSEKFSSNLIVDPNYVFSYLSKSHKGEPEEEFLGGLIKKLKNY